MIYWEEIYHFLGSVFFFIASLAGVVFLYFLIRVCLLRARIEKEINEIFEEVKSDIKSFKQKITEIWLMVVKVPQFLKELSRKVKKRKNG